MVLSSESQLNRADGVDVRALRSDDDLAALTALIHAAYARHTRSGLRFWGTHQSIEDTAKRFASGFAIVATSGLRYIGTVTVRPPQSKSPVALYRASDVW